MDIFTVEGGFVEILEQKLHEGKTVENWSCQEYKRSFLANPKVTLL